MITSVMYKLAADYAGMPFAPWHGGQHQQPAPYAPEYSAGQSNPYVMPMIYGTGLGLGAGAVAGYSSEAARRAAAEEHVQKAIDKQKGVLQRSVQNRNDFNMKNKGATPHPTNPGSMMLRQDEARDAAEKAFRRQAESLRNVRAVKTPDGKTKAPLSSQQIKARRNELHRLRNEWLAAQKRSVEAANQHAFLNNEVSRQTQRMADLEKRLATVQKTPARFGRMAKWVGGGGLAGALGAGALLYGTNLLNKHEWDS